MKIVKHGRTEVAEIRPGTWSAVGPLGEVSQVLAKAKEYGDIAHTAPQPAGNGLVLVHFQRRAAQPRQHPAPPRLARRPVAPSKHWALCHWRPLAGAAGVVLVLAVLGALWLAAHLDELVALLVKGLLTLAGIGVVTALIAAGLSGGGGSGHCPGPWHK